MTRELKYQRIILVAGVYYLIRYYTNGSIHKTKFGKRKKQS